MMVELIEKMVPMLAALGAVGSSIALIVRETYKGKATLIRARRGDPEPGPRVIVIENK